MSHWKVNPKETWDGWEVCAPAEFPERTLPNVPRTIALVTSQPHAYMIAATPELYEALEAFLHTYADTQKHPSVVDESRVIAIARAALAKARGENL